MEDSDLLPFATWSLLTGIIVVITGLSYRAYMRRRKNETPKA